MERGTGKNAVEEAMLVHVRCANGAVFNFDVVGGYIGEEERWWFETLSTRGSTRLAPLRVVKELHGRPTDVSPRGAAARESAFIQSYRAELAHFAAVIAGDAEYEAPADQMLLHRVVEAIYKSAEEERRSGCDAGFGPRLARAIGVALLALCAARGSSHARRRAPPPLQAATPAASDDLEITLVTFGLGQEVFERFGHNAIWVHDARTAPT